MARKLHAADIADRELIATAVSYTTANCYTLLIRLASPGEASGLRKWLLPRTHSDRRPKEGNRPHHRHIARHRNLPGDNHREGGRDHALPADQ